MAKGHNLFVSYDLMNQKNYPKVAEAIQGLGTAVRVNLSYWFVDSGLTAEAAANRVWAAMDRDDKLIVVDAKSNQAYWYNLDSNASSLMQRLWNH